jgi:cation:H+ antiporter
MLLVTLQFVTLAALIIAAGTVLARCADVIAESTGLGRLLVGSVLLAGATSLPELSVDISAVRLNLPDLAMGDLLGSSLMNLLILAALDLTHYSRGKMLSRVAAAHALGGLFSIALTGVVGLGLLTVRRVEHWAWLGVHAWVWVLAVSYVLGVRMVFLNQRVAEREAHEQNLTTPAEQSHLPLWRAIIGFALAALTVLAAGPYLAEAAGKIAELSGLGNTFVGTTLVALCTSLPELAASYAAIRIGSLDLAIGNVFGSNAFNMLLFLPLELAFPGALFAAVNPVHVISVLAVIVSTSVVIMGQLYNVEMRTRLLEPDATIVIAIILGCLAIVYYAR